MKPKRAQGFRNRRVDDSCLGTGGDGVTPGTPGFLFRCLYRFTRGAVVHMRPSPLTYLDLPCQGEPEPGECAECIKRGENSNRREAHEKS